MSSKRLLGAFILLSGALCVVWPAPAPAYIGGPPGTLGMMCYWSTHAVQVQVEKVDKEKGVIIWRKLKDYKGKWPSELIKQTVAPGLADRAHILQWAEVGRTTVMFALESYKWSHTYIDNCWYASTTGDWQWWNVNHVEPIVLRTYSGRTEKLQAAVGAIYAGQEVVVPCMVDGNAQDLALRKAKLQRLRASLKLLDYNAKRDFVNWGGDDFATLHGMPGFSHFSTLTRVGPDAQAISVTDFDGDGKPDLCLLGSNRLALLQNAGDALLEINVPGLTGGGRAAVWADYNGDGKPDLLLATATGPKLYTNLGSGTFRDDTALLPKEPHYNLTAAAWIDYDGDGKPDILLGNGFHGLRLYRNRGKAEPVPPQPGKPPQPPQWFEDVSTTVGLGPDGIGSTVKGDTLTVCDVNGDGRPDILYGASTGMLILNTADGFLEARNCGIVYQPGKIGPVFGDFDNSGAPSLFVPQLDGQCKLFKNDGKGQFTDVTKQSGDLAKPIGMATSAAWGDLDNDGHLDLVVGCLRTPNRVYRNRGDGTFADVTEEMGFHQRVFNSQAVSILDLNQDGALDIIFNNEGQDSVVLLGDVARPRVRTPLTLGLNGTSGIVGSKVRVVDGGGQTVAAHEVGTGEGRGGQAGAQLHFALKPGNYRLEVRYTSGLTRSRELTIEQVPLRGMLADR
jgi:hypothetical protein